MQDSHTTQFLVVGAVAAAALALYFLVETPQDQQDREEQEYEEKWQKKMELMKIDFDKKFSRRNIEDFYNFDAKKIVGAGVFGQVCEGRLIADPDQRFAIKCQKIRGVFQAQNLATEVSLLQQLDHPNLLKFFEVFNNKDFFYIVTEWCDQGDLEHYWMKKQTDTSEPQIAKIMLKMLKAVAYLHNHGIIHRDIKQANIMIVSNGTEIEFKLGDLGVGLKLENPDSHFKSSHGDPMIIAPEMFEKADKRDMTNIVDVWSLGVLMYWLFTKKKLFYFDREAEDHVQDVQYDNMVDQIKYAPILFDGPIWEKCSDEGKNLIKLMLERNIKKRPTVKECLNHVWFKEQIVSDSQNNQVSLDPTRDFKVKKRLEIHALRYLARTLNLSNVTNTFLKLDSDSSGSLGPAEFKEAFKDSGITEEELGKMFDEVDFNQDGDINYSEFMVAFARKEVTKDVKHLEAVFKHFCDDNGFITPKSLVKSYKQEGKDIDLAEATRMISEVEHSDGHQINIQQFTRLMTGSKIDQ